MSCGLRMPEVAELPTTARTTTTSVRHWNVATLNFLHILQYLCILLEQAASIVPHSGAAGMGQDRDSLRVQEGLQSLSAAIFDERRRRALLELRDDNAQWVIDYLNALLSHPVLVDPKLRKHILIVLRKLCENSMLYPSCYSINGIESISLIGAGGFCDIYQGCYQGQTLCLKVVRLYEREDQDKMLKAHAREAILWNQLKHPNVTPFYGIFYLEELQKRISLLSPWMQHGSIVKYLKGNSQLPRKQFLYDIASGLEYLHNEDIVHGDLKGANVLLDGSFTARISDFGLSKISTDATLGFFDPSEAMAGFTPNWASPELLEDHAHPTRESDIWAFGCVCYEILTGLSPFHGCTIVQVARRMLDGKLPAQPVNDRLDPNIDVNIKIWALLKRCWSYEIARRPECSEILQEMKNDAPVWQPRTEGPSCETQLPLYKARIANPILDLYQPRWFLDITDRSKTEQPRILNDGNLSDNQVSFIKEISAASPRPPPVHHSHPPLPTPLLTNPLNPTGVPCCSSLGPSAAIRSSPSRSSLQSPPEANVGDQGEERARAGGGEFRNIDHHHPASDQLFSINQCLCQIPAWLSSCLQLICCCQCFSHPPVQRTPARHPFDHRTISDNLSDEPRPPPSLTVLVAQQTDEVELNVVQVHSSSDLGPQQPFHPHPTVESPYLPSSSPDVESPQLPYSPPNVESLQLPYPPPNVESPQLPYSPPNVGYPRLPYSPPNVGYPRLPYSPPNVGYPRLPYSPPNVGYPRLPYSPPNVGYPRLPYPLPNLDSSQPPLHSPDVGFPQLPYPPPDVGFLPFPYRAQSVGSPRLPYPPPNVRSPRLLQRQPLPPGERPIKRPQPPSDQHLLQELHENEDIFEARDSISIDDHRTMLGRIPSDSDLFMAYLQSTIPEIQSVPGPPPRCHPGTRVHIIERCLHFVNYNSRGTKKILWLFGAAGAGKSAIVQNVAESPRLIDRSFERASILLSVKRHSDGSRFIIAICYQIATKFAFYRVFLHSTVKQYPSLLQSSMATQFEKLIVVPFTSSNMKMVDRILVIVDDLDECEHRDSQLELLRLILTHSINHPSSPLVWFIASRPEHHITSFFSTPTARLSCQNEEISVDSDDSCKDVELFLRHQLGEIKKESQTLDHQSEWPKERDILALANASDGLFAFAYAIINYIGNPPVEDVASKLRDILKVIDGDPIPSGPQMKHPMALFDALYIRILSDVPPEVMEKTRKFLLALVLEWDWFLYPNESNFIVLCNWLALTAHGAYTALFPLFSVLHVPMGPKACNERLRAFHKSFIGYISDFSRFGLFEDVYLEARQLKNSCIRRILKEAPDGIDFGEMNYEYFFGDLARGPGKGDKISLTWPTYVDDGWNDNETRMSMYKTAIGWVIDGIRSGEPYFQDLFYIRLLTTRFKRYGYFPYDEFSDLVFDTSRRDEYIRDGLLKQVPFEAINFSTLDECIRLWFRCPSATVTTESIPWSSTCAHKRKGEWETGKDHDWKTNISRRCSFCWKRFEQHLTVWKIQTQGRPVPVLFSSTGKCCAELVFSDSEDDGVPVPVWTYRLWFELSSEERRKYGATV